MKPSSESSVEKMCELLSRHGSIAKKIFRFDFIVLSLEEARIGWLIKRVIRTKRVS